MKDPLNDKLTEHLKNQLEVHEESYAMGAWENFIRKRKQREKAVYWKRSLSIAAAVVLAFVVYLFFQMDPADKNVAEEKTITLNKDTQSAEEGISANTQIGDVEKADPLPKNPLTDSEVSKNKDRNLLKESLADKKAVMKSLVQTPDSETTTKDREHLMVSEKDPIMPVEPIHPALQGLAIRFPFLFQEKNTMPDDFFPLKEKAKAKTLALGIAFTPMMSATEKATNWNLGGGLSLHWDFMKNLSLSSGVYLAHHQLTFDKESGLESTDPAHLDGVEVNLMGLEVPVSIRYHIYDNLFVSAGLSSTTFLKENYNYTYQYQREIEVVEYTESTGYQVITKLVDYTETATETEPAFNSIDWAAFYTFSIGYNYQFSKKYQLSVEPFVKFPTSNVASRNIKYTSGGLQLKLLFK